MRRKGGEANGDGGGAASGSGEGQERRGIPARFGAWLAQCHAGRRAPDPPDRVEARGAMDVVGGYKVEAERNFWIGGSGIWNEEEGERWLGGEGSGGDPERVWSGGGGGNGTMGQGA